MRFQSKYRNHKLIYKPTLRVMYPGQGSPTITPGVRVEFDAHSRVWDSEKAQRQYGWDDELRSELEDFVLKHEDYGNGIYLAPGQDLPEDKLAVARVKPKEHKRFCQKIEIDDLTGDVIQCENEPTVGRKFCNEHDPDAPKIRRGLSKAT